MVAKQVSLKLVIQRLACVCFTAHCVVPLLNPYIIATTTECGGWHDLTTKEVKNGKVRYPRFEGRKFDEGKCVHVIMETDCFILCNPQLCFQPRFVYLIHCFAACRKERMAKLAEVEKKHGKMTSAGKIVDSNFQSKFNGLSNFSDE